MGCKWSNLTTKLSSWLRKIFSKQLEGKYWKIKDLVIIDWNLGDLIAVIVVEYIVYLWFIHLYLDIGSSYSFITLYILAFIIRRKHV